MSKSLKYLRLTALFALLIFIILLATVTLTFCGALLMGTLGIIPSENLNRFPLFLFCVAILLIGTFMSVFFSKTLLRPIREIIVATDRIANGDYSVRLSLKGIDEYKNLSNKFNHMAQELDSVEMLRSDFVNNFSHEFKTPIVSIRGFAKALKQENISQEERNEYLDIIIDESERLVSLSTNVLYLSKIESQSILTHKKRFNLSEQIRLAIALLDQKFEEKNLELEFSGDEIFYEGNEEMMKQVWINLLDNAIKFSPNKGKITISINNANDHISVKIRDNGHGMTPEQKEHIFDKFYQGDTSHTTNGNGLGLAIVKKIIDLHNGQIIVRSSDKGSTFEVILKELPSIE